MEVCHAHNYILYSKSLKGNTEKGLSSKVLKFWNLGSNKLTLTSS